MEKIIKSARKLQAMARKVYCERSKRKLCNLVKILEGHYMNLFKSREYTDALHNTISKMEIIF